MSNNDLKNSKKNEVSDKKLGKVSGGSFDDNMFFCEKCNSVTHWHQLGSEKYHLACDVCGCDEWF